MPQLPPISYRPPPALRVRLMEYAAQTGLPVNQIITQALDRHLPPGPTEAHPD